MTHNRAELLKQFLITAIKSDDDKIVFTKGAVKDMWLYICCLEGENEFYNKKLKERQAEIERLARSNSISQHLLSDAYDSIKRLDKLNETAKAEAIKKFENRFENKINEIDFPKYAVVEKMLVICKQMMNDIVKEMVGEQG